MNSKEALRKIPDNAVGFDVTEHLYLKPYKDIIKKDLALLEDIKDILKTVCIVHDDNNKYTLETRDTFDKKLLDDTLYKLGYLLVKMEGKGE